jgi:hypothetical protein
LSCCWPDWTFIRHSRIIGSSAASSEAAATSAQQPVCAEQAEIETRIAPDVVFPADLYAKSEKDYLSHAERSQLKKIAAEIRSEFGA